MGIFSDPPSLRQRWQANAPPLGVLADEETSKQSTGLGEDSHTAESGEMLEVQQEKQDRPDLEIKFAKSLMLSSK
jgi:hypothetical protein